MRTVWTVLLLLLSLAIGLPLEARAATPGAAESAEINPPPRLSFALSSDGQATQPAVSTFTIEVPQRYWGKTVALADYPLGPQGAQAVIITFKPDDGPANLGRTRFYIASATGLKSGFGSLSRKLAISVEGVPEPKISDYTIVEGSTSAGRFTQSLLPSETPWTQAAAGIPVELDVSSNQLTGLRVTGQPFQDDGNKRFIEAGLKLCRQAGGLGAPCAEVTSLPAPGHYRLFLAAGGERPPAGIYKGQVLLTADGAPSASPSAMTITVTSAGYWLMGGLLLALGVALAFVVTQFLPTRSARLDVLRPLAVLSGEVAQLRDRFGKFAECLKNMPNTEDALANLERDSSEQAFDEKFGAPNSVVRFFPAGAPADALAIKAYLEDIARRLAALSVLGDHALARLEPVFDTAKPLAGETAAALDKLVGDGSAITAQNLASQADSLMAQMQSKIDATTALADQPAGFWKGPASPTSSMSLVQIDYEVRALNWVGWLGWGLLTVLTGFYTLVASKAGFGSFADLLLCFLWGIGLPATGEALKGLTPTAIRSTLQVPGR